MEISAITRLIRPNVGSVRFAFQRPSAVAGGFASQASVSVPWASMTTISKVSSTKVVLHVGPILLDDNFGWYICGKNKFEEISKCQRNDKVTVSNHSLFVFLLV